MSAYKYVETHERYYPRLGLTARPGETHDFDGEPPDDGRWEPAKKARRTNPDTAIEE